MANQERKMHFIVNNSNGFIFGINFLGETSG